jgi:anthranilate phosphoribosyltransferase
MSASDDRSPSDQSFLRRSLTEVVGGERLTSSQSKTLVECLMRSDLDDPEMVALASGIVCAMKTRGESVDEIVGAAQCLRERQLSVPMGAPGQVLLDTCGTGGDGAHLINISTLAALVTASLGIKVAKHGNRSVSSACGSADLLEQLGYPLLADPARVAANVMHSGFGFLFAPHFHPALRNLAGFRRRLGVRTLFNLLGPLVNPAGATHQIIGVFAQDMVEPLAWATGRLGLTKALIVHGEGGLDELSPWGTTWVCLSQSGVDGVESWEWTPQTFGAPRVGLESLRGGDAARNATIAQEMLDGGRPEVATVVAMNAAAALWVADAEIDLRAGFERSYEALRQGDVGRYFRRCLEAASAEVS